ncbi:plasmid transfer protein [Bifidobacterium animalis subsp. animalis MCC 0499]|uniref:FtsK/SpoIIIE domain-containing protein n=1 Tax=Bifidobacterium animalis TaxID=28025 RepID=UPI00069B2FE1|nr:FtsK/SpoIIIE domain-containing protein [Bifidobacterium animalis]KOA59026.1 plasmid transfer protein [Bifidobacterium animalis subsp. animalis MCC 0499]
MWLWHRNEPQLDEIGYGKDQSGRPVAVSAKRHTLVMGLTGSGKGSISAGWIVSQLPFILDGQVRLYYIDLKNGMEAGMLNQSLIYRQAWTLEEAVNLLHGFDEEARKRQDKYRGQVREVTPDMEPRMLLIIDEAAELMSTTTENKKLSAEAVGTLESVLRRGRSAGCVVLALTQDPRVNSFPLRPRFPQRMALRLNDESEARMALGDIAVEHGAAPWLIPANRPGSCWFSDLDTGDVQFFHARYVPDGELRNLGNTAAGA